MFNSLTSNIMFGLILSIGLYFVGVWIHKKFPNPFLSPLVTAVILGILFLNITGIKYENFYDGGQFLNMLITPATVAIAIPLYNSFHLLKKHYRSILAGIAIGATFGVLATGGLAMIFGLDKISILSLMPKSVTTAIALGVSDKLGGSTSLTLAAVIITGIVGSISGPYVFKILKITDPVAKGIAMGTTAHAVGTAEAIKMGRVEGAMSGLAIGVTGGLTVIIAPIVVQLLQIK
ncbi:MAG: LrgB family protein [Lactobacillales bacterium]|jgi:predicted murein hydrolase (TIGR00659 family)|nr:LrgB family protein [Lactobacillales bacterium]